MAMILLLADFADTKFYSDMLLVLPFSVNDHRLALALAKYFQYVGPYKTHEIMISAPADCEEYIDEIREAIGDQFAKTYIFLQTQYQEGWPGGPNKTFHSIAWYIFTEIDCKSWYFFEPDNTPIKPNWLNTLADEYDRTGRPFMGVIHPSFWKRNVGTPNERFIQDGTHLVGTSIYPKNAPIYSKLFKSIPVAAIPWDVYWQWEIGKYAVNTNLIHHEWRTFKWRRDKRTGELKGERLRGTLPYEPIPLRPDAVVLHGCKDGSLMNIMRSLIASRATPLEVPVMAEPEPEPEPEPELPIVMEVDAPVRDQ